MGRILSYFIVISLITIIRTLLLRKGKPTISVIEWANASRLGLRYNDRTRSDQQEAQKRKVPETLDFFTSRGWWTWNFFGFSSSISIQKKIRKGRGAKSLASHCALIERYEMVPRKELLSHENHLHFNFLPIFGIQENKNSSA